MPTYPRGSGQQTPQVEQPPSIKTAVTLMRAGAVLSLLSLVVGLLTLGSLKDNIRNQLQNNNTTFSQSDLDTTYHVAIATAVILGILGIALWLWMAQANGNGRKWARIVATVLGVINVLLTAVSLAQGQTPGLSLVFSVIGAILALVIVVMLWRKESTAFYQERSNRQLA